MPGLILQKLQQRGFVGIEYIEETQSIFKD